MTDNGSARSDNGVRDIDAEIKADTMKAAWGTFVTLLLGAGAAVVGGLLASSGLPKTKSVEAHTTV
jgi:hypothetical protein